jgi:hypothetical protein
LVSGHKKKRISNALGRFCLPPLPQLVEYRSADLITDVAGLLSAYPRLETLSVSYGSIAHEDAATDAIAKHPSLVTLRLDGTITFPRSAIAAVQQVRDQRREHRLRMFERQNQHTRLSTLANDTSIPRRAFGLAIEVDWCHNPFRDDDDSDCYMWSSRIRLITRDLYAPTQCICNALSKQSRHCESAGDDDVGNTKRRPKASRLKDDVTVNGGCGSRVALDRYKKNAVDLSANERITGRQWAAIVIVTGVAVTLMSAIFS